MNWYHHPEVIEKLAAEYALGTLNGLARRRFEAVMHQRADVRLATFAWQEKLSPLLESLPEVTPDKQTWLQISSRLWPSQTINKEPLWRRLFAPLPLATLVFGLAIGTILPGLWQAKFDSQHISQLPESYVGVLATQSGAPGLIVSSLRHGITVDLKQLAPLSVATGYTLYLWKIDKTGTSSPVGPMPNRKFSSIQLSLPSEKAFSGAIELAVSIEQVGIMPDAPTQPFVYRGLCGKLWRPPAS